MQIRRLIGALMIAALLIGLLSPLPALANETGKKHTTIILGASSVLSMLTHHPRNATWLGLGTAYSYYTYQREHNHNKRAQAYRKGYRRGYSAARH